MTGEHTVSLVGSYHTLALAIVAWNNGNTTAQTPDHFELIIDPVVASGIERFHLIKVEISA